MSHLLFHPVAQAVSQSSHCSPELFVSFQNVFLVCLLSLDFSVKQMFPNSRFSEMSAAQWCELRPVTVREAERMQDPRYQESLFLQREQTLRDFKVHLVFFTDAMIWLR